MKKWIGFLLMGVVLINAAGCASVQKKFTRKKKEPRHIPAAVYLQETGAYQKKYSNDYYYKTHFTFWKSWQDELINQLGGNNKKVTRSAQEALGHLREMNNYLTPLKQEELRPQLDSLAKINQRIESSGYSDAEIGSLRVELERIMRIVSNNFYYDKVKNEIIPETVDLGTPASQ